LTVVTKPIPLMITRIFWLLSSPMIYRFVFITIS
jgi:hypothetical protein